MGEGKRQAKKLNAFCSHQTGAHLTRSPRKNVGQRGVDGGDTPLLQKTVCVEEVAAGKSPEGEQLVREGKKRGRRGSGQLQYLRGLRGVEGSGRG